MISRIDGRNLPLDALLEVCGIDPAGKAQVGQAVAALNGQTGTSGRVLRQGIRHLFWIEASRWAEENDRLDRLREYHGSPLEFSTTLALAIRRKASRYQRTLPGATLTPTALAKWWLDLEREVSDRPMTPSEIEAFLNAEVNGG